MLTEKERAQAADILMEAGQDRPDKLPGFSKAGWWPREVTR